MTAAPPAPRLDAIGIVVEDMARALAFYRELGLDLPADADGAPHAEATLAGGLRLMWDTIETIKSFDPKWTPPSGGFRVGFAFLCESPEAVDALHARMVGLGYASYHDPWDAFWGQRYATVLDPDGNGVDLFCPLPQS